MKWIRFLALLPFLGMLGGPFLFNRVEPLVLGIPLLLAWMVGMTLATSVIMGVIYLLDPQNRRGVAAIEPGEDS